ncbi:redox-regulated ATPase YchF [Patescibacteria group bacterium]
MSFSVGIVGLPNVGKSTLFSALTKQQVEAKNYPFTTIDPNVGVVKVPDTRLDKLAELSKSAQVIPTVIEFHDIAGLVKGASKGEGLGNKFLENIRQVDAIAEKVRLFEDDDITHVEGVVDPVSDIEAINIELVLADINLLEKLIGHTEKEAKGQDKEAVARLVVLEKLNAALMEEKLAITVELSEEEESLIKDVHLLTRKPILYVFNVKEDQIKDMAALVAQVEEIRAKSAFPIERYVILSAKIEQEIGELSDEDQKEFLSDYGLVQSGVTDLVAESYKLLDLITFFTSGEKETRAWTIPKGAKAPQAGGAIHSDFEEKFIRAEVIGYTDFAAGGELAARDAGKMRLEGKDYVVADGDVMVFRFGK